jgi:hypothetical protein
MPFDQPVPIARLRGRQRIQGAKIEDAAEQRSDLRTGQVRPPPCFVTPST